jgi:hypothetical protein
MTFLAFISLTRRFLFTSLSYNLAVQGKVLWPMRCDAGSDTLCDQTADLQLPSLLQMQAMQSLRMPALPDFFEEDAIGSAPSASSDRDLAFAHDVGSAVEPPTPREVVSPAAGATSQKDGPAVKDSHISEAKQITVEPPVPPESLGMADDYSPPGPRGGLDSVGKASPEALSLLDLAAPTSWDSVVDQDKHIAGHMKPGEPPHIAGDVGEEGETVDTQSQLHRLMFPNKDESLLELDRHLLKHQHEFDEKHEEAKEAIARLKARTYESADMSQWRLKEAQRLQTGLQRMELLADANKYKADLTAQSSQKFQHLAELERANHLLREGLEAERWRANSTGGEAQEIESSKPRKNGSPQEEEPDMAKDLAAAVEELTRKEEIAASDTVQVEDLNPPLDGHCRPTCTWSCKSPKCDELCTPACRAPRCETRCSSLSTEGCVMECTKPHCAIMCPKNLCSTSDCPSCTTQCSEPQCKMKCPTSNSRFCHNYCEQPHCEWRCKAPTHCPKPKCQMVCETPKKCNGATYSQRLPPLLPGESGVETFAAPIGGISNDRTKAATVSSGSGEMLQAVEVPSTPSMDVQVRSLAPELAEPQTSMVSLPVVQDERLAF